MNRRVPIVLLIEPEAIQGVRLTRTLKDGGYSVIPVRRADDALETFVTHHLGADSAAQPAPAGRDAFESPARVKQLGDFDFTLLFRQTPGRHEDRKSR